jgi:hypothetical protein
MCHWEGADCPGEIEMLAFAEIPADEVISVAGTYAASFRHAIFDGRLLRHLCTGLVIAQGDSELRSDLPIVITLN